MSLLSICIVDTWFAYSGILETHECQNNFYGYLAEEIVDNRYDYNRRINRSVGDPRRRIINDLELSPLIKMMDQVGMGCIFTSHLLNEKEQVVKVRYHLMRYKEDVKYAQIRQQCAAANVKTMITWKKLFFMQFKD